MKIASKTLSFLIAFSMLSGVSANVWHIHEPGDSCEHNDCCGHAKQDYSSVIHFDKVPLAGQTHIDCLICLTLKFQHAKVLFFAEILFFEKSINVENSENYSFAAFIFANSFFGRAPPTV